MRLLFSTCCLLLFNLTHGQVVSNISLNQISRIENILAADDMQGRKVYTPGIERAASFIVHEFEQAGLKPFQGKKDFRQNFALLEPTATHVSGNLDGAVIDQKQIFALTADSMIQVTPKKNYRKIFVKKGDNLFDVFIKYIDGDENLLVLIDTTFADKFARLKNYRMPQFSGSGNRIFILSSTDPQSYFIDISQQLKIHELSNLVGILPGKSKPDEYVIFSAHYDHLGIGKPDDSGDSLYNGANDDASGTTAVIALAKYYAQRNDNQRTIIFAAFTAEEIGEFGSLYFSKTLDPKKVAAMFNIEMIGTESKWGLNSAYITGFEKSSMGQILQRNLANSPFRFNPDPYPEQMLFSRSDNASLAKQGVPAHTISTSKMDSEKYYHKQGDEVKTLNLENMTKIIEAIAISAGSIISAQDTPTRVAID